MSNSDNFVCFSFSLHFSLRVNKVETRFDWIAIFIFFQSRPRNQFLCNLSVNENIFENVAREPIAELRAVFSIYFGVEPPKQYQRILHANLKQ